jgi:hypothetical protein
MAHGPAPQIVRSGKVDLCLHGPVAVAGKLEGVLGIAKTHRMRDQLLHVDQPLLHQAHAYRELVVKPEGAAQVEFLRRNRHLRRRVRSPELQEADPAVPEFDHRRRSQAGF